MVLLFIADRESSIVNREWCVRYQREHSIADCVVIGSRGIPCGCPLKRQSCIIAGIFHRLSTIPSSPVGSAPGGFDRLSHRVRSEPELRSVNKHSILHGSSTYPPLQWSVDRGPWTYPPLPWSVDCGPWTNALTSDPAVKSLTIVPAS